MKDAGAFFVGWSAEAPGIGRRALLGAGCVLGAGGAGLALALVGSSAIGDGSWDMDRVRVLRGVVAARPYPALRTLDLDGTARTVFLASDGKTAVRLAPQFVGRWAECRGTLIARDAHAMLALDAMRAAPGGEPAGLREPEPVDHGEVLLSGEILDAKCWFGAMRPGYGKTHKACAALCARGGLPLAFCRSSACGKGPLAPLFLDADGRPHALDVLPFVADPVWLRGQLVQTGDVMQLRAGLAAIRRL